MKKFSFIVAMVAILTLMLAACGDNEDADKAKDDQSKDAEANDTKDLEYEPVDIDPDKDVCAVCGMAIDDDEHATEIILENDKPVKFDDLGDLFEWVDENGEDEIGAKFVRDFNTKEWIPLEDATYVYDDDIDTPMGFGVISFKDKETAEEYIDEMGFGELLSASDLEDHDWDMDMDDDHDHEDHEGHDEHDHEDHEDHGDHDHEDDDD